MPLRRLARRRPGQAAARPADAGFLLVEVLVTMAISAFLLVALASVVSLMLRAFDRTSRMGEGLETTSLLFSSLSRDLSLIGRSTFAGKDAGFVFSGTADGVVYAYDRFQEGRGETRVVDLASTAVPGGFRLERREAPFVPSSRGMEDVVFGVPQSVHAGRARVRFAYYDALPGGAEALVDDWAAPDRLPVAIRVTLSDDRPGEVDLSLRIPLAITAEPGCAAPETGACRSAPKPGAGETGGEGDTGSEAVQADDPLGWQRYVQ